VRDQPSLHQRLDVVPFLFHGLQLRPVGLGLGLPAGDLGLELRDFLVDDVALAGKRREPAFELMHLSTPDPGKNKITRQRL